MSWKDVKGRSYKENNFSYYEDDIISNVKSIPGGHVRLNGNRNTFWVSCRFHAQDRTPSLKINLGSPFPGSFYCFGCGMSGNYDTLAEKYDLPRLQDSRYFDSFSDIRLEETDDIGEFYGDDSYDWFPRNGVPWPIEIPWRNIHGKLMRTIGALRYFDNRISEYKCHIPVTYNHKKSGFINALCRSGTGEKRPDGSFDMTYINARGSWSKKHFFMFDWCSRHKVKDLYLVEGPRDALNLIQHGLDAIALLGSQSWSEEKKQKLLRLSPYRLINALDPDIAGEKARKKINSDLAGYLNIFNLRFPAGRDPGNLTNRQIKEMLITVNR